MREFNGPSFKITGAMGGKVEDETPTEESRMPVRRFIANREVRAEGDEPQTKKICVETDEARCDSVDDFTSGIAGQVKSATRTVTKEGSEMFGSMPRQDERRRD